MVIIEGILVLHMEEIREMLNMKVGVLVGDGGECFRWLRRGVADGGTHAK